MQKRENFPRILVVDGTPLSNTGNMGSLKTHLLNKWPSSAIGHIITSGIVDLKSIASKQFIITKRGIMTFSSGFELNVLSSSINNEKRIIPKQKTKNTFIKVFNFIRVLLFVKLYKVYKPITHFLRSSAGVQSEKLTNFIKKFDPDIILTFGVTLPELKAAYLISQDHNKPLIMYIADDYISWTYKDHFFSKYFRAEFDKYFSLALNSSVLRVTIGKKMEEEYSKRYKLSFQTIMDGIDTTLYMNRPIQKNIHEIICYYIGSFEPDRSNNLKKIALALENINAKNNKKIKLAILGFENDKLKYGKKFEEIDCVEFMDTVPHHDVPNIQMKADVLIHVESFNEFVSSSMTKYSISTKLSQYIASGTPIFAFGPKGIASMEYLRSLNAAKIVDIDNNLILENDLFNFINDLSEHKKNSERLRKVALKNLSIETVGENFYLVVKKFLENEATNKSIDSTR